MSEEAVEKKEKKEKKVMTPERLEQLARARKKALEIRQAGAAIKEEQKQLADAALEEKLQREKELNDAVKKSLLKNEINNDKLHTVPIYRNNVVPRLEGSAPPITQRVWDASHEEEEERLEGSAPPITQRVWDASHDYREASARRQPREEEEDGGRPIRDYREASARRQPREKTKKPIKTKVVIEQSSDDEDEFHTNEHVIFVKRKSKNDSIKKVPATTPVPPNTPEDGQRPPPYQAHRQLPNVPLPNTMDDFVNAGFSNYRKYY